MTSIDHKNKKKRMQGDTKCGNKAGRCAKVLLEAGMARRYVEFLETNIYLYVKTTLTNHTYYTIHTIKDRRYRRKRKNNYKSKGYKNNYIKYVN